MIPQGEDNLHTLLKNLNPILNDGAYVFVTSQDPLSIDRSEVICEFAETEGTTFVIKKEAADQMDLSYDFVASWITLKVHSSLHAVGLTARFSECLTQQNISANVIAGYYHDHIFVDINDAEKALAALQSLSKSK